MQVSRCIAAAQIEIYSKNIIMHKIDCVKCKNTKFRDFSQNAVKNGGKFY